MKNKLLLTSITTIFGLYAILILVLLIVFNIFGLSISYLLISSIVFLIIQFLISPPLMDFVMKCFYNVNFDVTMPAYLKEYIEKVCADNKMKYPKIGYIKDKAPNAFTYGRTKNDARIILTEGIFNLLNEEEIKAVVSHEIGHAVHYDMFLMTAVQIVPLVLYYIYDITINSISSDDDNKGFQAIIGLLSYILYIVSEYIILWFSRTREYYADEFSVITTKNPNALASALVKIGYGLTISNNDNLEQENEDKKTKKKKKKHISSVSALGIFDEKSSKSLVITSYNDSGISTDNIKKAARWELWNPWATWYEINSTHPLISKRIKAICKYCGTYNQNAFINFEENKPESYLDDFAIEVIIKFLPWTILCCLIIIIVLTKGNIANPNMFIGFSMMMLAITMLIKHICSHQNYNYTEKNVSELLSEVKVSDITSIPCIVKGEIIGRGTPGFILSEDFVIKDESGIIFLDYRQPLAIINKIFALLKANNYINQKVEIKGWYRRAPIPYIEIYTITMNGQVKKCYSYGFKIWLLIILICIGAIIFTASLVG